MNAASSIGSIIRSVILPLLHLVILAIVQGVTEFLPVSSSGHLVLMPSLLGWEDQGLNIDIAVHVGTLGAVLVYFWRDLVAICISLFTRNASHSPENRILAKCLLISALPVLAAGAILVIFYPTAFRSPEIVAYTMILFGILLWVADRVGLTTKKLDQIRFRDALVIGLFQILALVPGTSRSGITITGARFLGYNRQSAARFSMLMSIPVILAAGGVTGIKLLEDDQTFLTGNEWIAAALAFGAALISIAFLIRILQHISFVPFVLYRIALGVALLCVYYYYGLP